MIKLDGTKIHVGTRVDSKLRNNPEWAVVNTAKTVHCEIMGWGTATPKDHPNYLCFEDSQLLSFNWVDGGAFLYKMSGPQAFIRALDFIDLWYNQKQILINCDQGKSRSPTVALLYLSKRLDLIPSSSFDDACKAFNSLYPNYSPSGIGDFVRQNWAEIT